MLRKQHTKAIRELMQTAKQHINWPKIRLQAGEQRIQLSIAGAASSRPDSINITDGAPYGSNKWFGRIEVDGKFTAARNANNAKIQDVLEIFAENPTGYAKIYGNHTGNCMFCGRELTDPQSVAVGYGPICADHFGLPHGNLEADVANEMTQFDLQIPWDGTDPDRITDAEPQQSLEERIAWLEDKITQLEATLYRIQSNGE